MKFKLALAALVLLIGLALFAFMSGSSTPAVISTPQSDGIVLGR